MLYQVPHVIIEIQTHDYTDRIGSCKSNYNMITTTTAPSIMDEITNQQRANKIMRYWTDIDKFIINVIMRLIWIALNNLFRLLLLLLQNIQIDGVLTAVGAGYRGGKSPTAGISGQQGESYPGLFIKLWTSTKGGEREGIVLIGAKLVTMGTII